jgi:nucleolar pre-ribosomal-associated protein 1
VTARVNFAFELVDWLRLINHPLHSNDIKRLMDAVERLHKPALREVAEHLDPGRPLLWGSLNIVSRWPEHRVESVTCYNNYIYHSLTV